MLCGINRKLGSHFGHGRRGEVMLEPIDVFSVPPGFMRGLRNVGTEPAHILAILGGTDPGKVRWSQKIGQLFKVYSAL